MRRLLPYDSLLILPVLLLLGLTGYAWASHVWTWPHVECLLAATGIAGGYVIVHVWRHLDLNRPAPNAPRYPSLGAANLITASRGLLLAFLVGFMCSGRPNSPLGWVPGILFTLNILADFADGIVARVTHRASLLGAHLDMHFDSLGVLLAALLVVRFGQMPPWFVLVGLARYLFLAGETLLRFMGRPTHPMPPSPTRRALAGIQMSFLAVALYPVVSPQATRIVGTFLFFPFMLGFVRDFLAVAGWSWPTESRWLRLSYWRRHALPLARLGTGGLLLWYTWRVCPTLAPHVSTTTLVLQGVLGFLLVAGVMTRLAAAIFLGVLAVHLTVMPSHFFHILLAAGGTVAILWGGGQYSLWTPDETLFLRRLGAS